MPDRDPSRLTILPDEGQIQAVFATHPEFESVRPLQDDDARLQLLEQHLVPALPQLMTGLHNVLTRVSGRNVPTNTGKHIFLHDNKTFGLSRVHGLHRTDIVQRRILPPLQSAFTELHQDTTLSTSSKLEIMAALTGTVIAQTQSLPDGNKRTARTLHDFIQHGPKGLNVQSIYQSRQDFMPPNDIEDLIMQQNLTRLTIVANPHEPSPDEILGGIYVDETVRRTLGRATLVWTDLIDQAKWMSRYEEPDFQYIGKGIRMIHRDLPEQLLSNTMAVLMQRSYGSAALAKLMYDADEAITIPLTVENAEQLDNTDTDLLVMRIMSLMGGIMAGGTFIEIVDSKVAGREKDITSISWLPNQSIRA